MEYSQANRQHYSDRVQKHGVGHIKCLWGGKRSQEVRFMQFLRFADFQGKSVTDIGCGFGDFSVWAQKQGVALKSYVGYELCEEHVAAAAAMNPDISIRCEDYLTAELDPVDISILSGTLNLNFDSWQEVAEAILDRMWRTSGHGILFNLESDWNISEEVRIRVKRNLDPFSWLKFARERTAWIVFSHDYHTDDFTIGMFHERQF